jgi:two-component system phosphate regulon sensor histidine kinase PhoR
MKREKTQLALLILTITSLLLLIGIQITWILKSARMQEAQFNHSVTMAMNRIVDNLSHEEFICKEMSNCIRKDKAQSCFFMMKNRMEWAALDTLIRNDLEYYNINLDYEFDIVEKGTANSPLSGKRIYVNDDLKKVLQQSGYELRIRFPEKRDYIKAQIGYIFISSIALLLLVCVSFIMIYKYYKREKKLTGNIIDFVNNITHEFKTPLTNIALANSMIARNELVGTDEKLSSYSKVIRDEQLRLKEKVEVLLKTTLSESDQPLNTEKFDAESEIKNVADTFSVQLDEKGGSVLINKSEQSFTVAGNIDMFHIAIGNIIDNAIRYSINNPQIVINFISISDKLRIEISDSGIGIPKEELPRIFEKYYRVPTGNIHNNNGFGLGLYYVKNTIERMHGTINVSSRMGKGTTFTIELPLSGK